MQEEPDDQAPDRFENHYSPKFKLTVSNAPTTNAQLPGRTQAPTGPKRPSTRMDAADKPHAQRLLDPEFKDDYETPVFKILLIGDANVGKTSLLLRFCEDDFNENLLSTIGIDFREKIIELDDRPIRLQIWDTAGQERFRSMSNSFYRGSHGILVVYDITNRKSFEHVSTWLSDITRYDDMQFSQTDQSADNIVKTIVGNKCDLDDLRMVSYDAARDFARKCTVDFMETSALNRMNVDRLFLDMARQMQAKDRESYCPVCDPC